MRVLLDTNVLIWSLENPDQLSAPAREAISATESEVKVSQISLLEIAIKASLGKLELDIALEELPGYIERSGFTLQSLSNGAIFLWPKLPFVHRDPFARLLICEAIQCGSTLVTPDPVIRRYAVHVLW